MSDDPVLRSLARRALRRLLWSRIDEPSTAELARSAWVFAPHQDDEVLGCGGTILRKRAVGARVRIAFLSDGSGSHKHLLPAGEIAALRRGEALRAARRLGVAESDVAFVGLEDGRLSALCDAGAAAVESLLVQHPSDEVYLPYRDEPPPDHAACNRMVRSGMRAARLSATAFEYPVWLWDAWPWTASSLREPATWRGEVSKILRTNARLLRDFRVGLRIAGELEQKRAALLEHRSQTSRDDRDESWPILQDIAEGAFLECLLQPVELFHCYRVEAGEPTASARTAPSSER